MKRVLLTIILAMSNILSYDKGSYYLIKTKISGSVYLENECVKK